MRRNADRKKLHVQILETARVASANGLSSSYESQTNKAANANANGRLELMQTAEINLRSESRGDEISAFIKTSWPAYSIWATYVVAKELHTSGIRGIDRANISKILR
jgi:hypothetical protein